MPAASAGGPPPRLSQVAPSSGSTAGADAPAPPQAPAASSAPEAPAAPPSQAAGDAAVSIEQVRALWQSVLDDVKSRSKVAWVMLVEAHPSAIDGGTLVVSHSDAGTVKRFSQSAAHEDKVRQATQAVIGVPLRLQMINADASGHVPAANTTPRARVEPEAPPVDEITDSIDVSEADGIELLEKKLGGIKIDERDDA